MSTNHTPGPWMWDSDPIKGDPLGRVRYQVVARGETITQCYYSSSDEQAEWDARLIAATPDLLEALTNLMRNFPTDFDMKAAGWDGMDIEKACAAHDMARAAIAKVTGGAA